MHTSIKTPLERNGHKWLPKFEESEHTAQDMRNAMGGDMRSGMTIRAVNLEIGAARLNYRPLLRETSHEHNYLD